MTQSLAERLRSLAQIASLVNSGTALPEILERITVAVCQRSPWSSSALMAVDERSGFSELVARYDPLYAKPPGDRDRWPLETSPTRTVLATGTLLVIRDAQEAADYADYREEARLRAYRTVVLLPLRAADGQGRGLVMSVHAHEVRKIDEDELAFLAAVAELASLAVEKAALLQLERQQTTHLRQVLELHAAAMERVLAGHPIPELARLVASDLPLPLVILDFTSHRAIAETSPLATVADADWQAAVRGRGYAHLAEMLVSAPAGAFARVRDLSLRPLGFESVLSAILEPCLVEGAILGGIILFTAGRPLDSFEALAAQGLRSALSVALLRAQVRFTTQAETHGEFFQRLFTGNWRDREETLARAGHLGLKLEAARFVLLQDDADKPGDAASRASLQRALLGVAQRSLPEASAFAEGGAELLHLPGTVLDEKALGRLMQRLVEAMQRQTGRRPIAVLSRACVALEDYRDARQAVARTVDLARRLGRSGVVAEGDFGPFARLIAAADREELRRFVADTVGRLETHDRSHGGEMLPTLEAFFAHHGRYQAAADALGIHVTTLRYRLRRVAELFGIALEDADSRIALELALRMRRGLAADAEEGSSISSK
jgi:purine catabolism regulator